MKKEISLYIHIPFCEQKCFYCAFNSACANQDEINNYIDLLCEEITKRKVDSVVRTIYFGGGTPSILKESELKKIVSTIFKNFDVYEDAEFTLEANPNSVTEEKLKCWKELRINRLSIGVQSLKDKSLQKIGRVHNKNLAIEKIKLARKYFDNVSADLIVGLENENGKDLCFYAKQLLELGIKHISCYLLEVYENTKLGHLVYEKKYKPLDDGQTIDAFNKLSNFLIDNGMERYEISNFAFPEYESKHNLNYWERGEYLGFGVSAHSFVNNKRIKNAENIAHYSAGITEVETLCEKDVVEEIIMLGLRCKTGVDLNQLEKLNFHIENNLFFEDYKKQGIILLKEKRMSLNPLFYHLSNTIISNLMPS